jgi:ribA/ribD-fused uncharacterized protein
MLVTDKFVFFYGGSLSNFSPAPFNMYGHRFRTSEHAYMWFKAIEFGDSVSAWAIHTEPSPKDAKKLGRLIKGFDDVVWSKVRYKYMMTCLKHKFCQNESHRKVLLSYPNHFFVEASPVDQVWGIGMSDIDDRCLDPNQWRGRNLLGRALDETREFIENKGCPILKDVV